MYVTFLHLFSLKNKLRFLTNTLISFNYYLNPNYKTIKAVRVTETVFNI